MKNDLIERYLPEALDALLRYDMSNEVFATALSQQAQLMAGISPDDYGPDPYAC